MERYYFMSYTTQYLDKGIEIGSVVTDLHPLLVIKNYNNHLSTGVVNHMLIYWKELVGEELEIHLSQ